MAIKAVRLDVMRSGSYGEYYEDCFIIKLNVPIDFSNLANSDDADHLGTFFHEYIHFLQNISTTFGNFSMAVFYAKMSDIFYNMANSPTHSIPKVIHYNDSVEPFAVRHEIILGDREDWTYDPCDFLSIEDVSLEKDDILEELGYGDCVLPQIKVLIAKDGKPDHKVLNFGAMCVMESMADMMDLHLYGKSKKGEFVQYDICKKLWEYYIGINYSDELIFRCCEYSLMYDNPGQIYHLALNTFSAELNNESISEISEALIDDFFLNRIKPNFRNTYQDNYEEMLRFVKDIIPEHNTFTKDVSEYVQECYEFFHDTRQANPLLITKIYKTEPQLAKLVLVQCMDIAVPLVINVDNESFVPNRLQTSKAGLEVYAAYYAIYNLFNNNPNICDLIDFCKMNSDGSIKDFCNKEPLVSIDESKLCVLGQMLRMWQSKVRQIVT